MYLPERGLIVTEVAKCGTHTLRAAVERYLGIDQPIASGHRKVSNIIAHAHRFGIMAKRDTTEIVCIVREPLDRLASAANHLYGREKSATVKSVIAEIDGDKNIYRPANEYLDVPEMTVRLFRFDNLRSALGYIVGRDVLEIPHENKSQKRFAAADFDCEDVRNFYADDFKLYERAE